ncbi:hypothetical protein [Cochlodiniinecator piscidefendens]|uniref:hypothetical protein n=1 Tax=Cochlodiniinecator piscidefendens TaxID=2715756 RepID=UPI00140D0E3F|nr:hypothetical protein [Cochlodiniinecator piscidefendens]
MKKYVLMMACIGATGCSVFGPRVTENSEATRPSPRPEIAIVEPSGPATAEAFDTTTTEERTAAVVTETEAQGAVSLGQTIASLGDPTDQGFWVKTPLVQSETSGYIRSDETGETVEVTLIPLEQDVGAGSQVSLAAMRLLGVSLTGLPVIEVFQN